MKIRAITLLLLIVAFTHARSFSQNPYLSAESIYGPNLLLYNGPLYSFFTAPGTIGSQFLDGPQFVKGSVEFRGEKFTHILLNYDIYNQKVVLEYKTQNNKLREIVLPNIWIKSFHLGEMHFETLSFPGTKPSIYQIIGRGHFQILYAWSKNVNYGDNTNVSDQAFLVFSKPLKETYLRSGDKLMPYKNNESFVALFDPENKPLLKKYLRKNRIKLNKLGKSGQASVLQLINYCNTLPRK